MEYGVPLIRLALSIVGFAFWTSVGAAAVAAEQKLVLVASASSPIASLSLPEARKIYLGVPYRVHDKAVQPLRNASDPLLVEVFMQRVMYMATETYDRQILNRVFRLGGERPPVFNEMQALTAALQANPWAISYAWRDKALASPELKVIGE